MRSLCVALFLIGCTLLLRGAPVTADNGNISFDAPDGFTALTPEEVAAKFPMKNGAMSAFGNENRTVSISYSVTQNALRPEQLPEAKDAMKSIMERVMPGLQWVKNDYIDIAGRKWVIFEIITHGSDQKIHNIEIFTSYRGVLLVVNFNATEKDFPGYSDRLLASLKTVKLKDDADQANLPASNPRPVSTAEEMKRGSDALAQGNYVLAHEAYTAATMMDPTNADVKAGLAKADAGLAAAKKAGDDKK